MHAVDQRRSKIDFGSVECLDGEHAGTEVMMKSVRMKP
jgi:elongation factor P hydroxylase